MPLCGIDYLYGLKIEMLKRLFPFALLILFAISCLDEPDCIGLNNNIVGFTFVSLDEEVGDTIAIEGVKIDGATIDGVIVKDSQGEQDTIFQPGTKTVVTSFTLPLNYFTNATTFELQLDTGFYDRDTTIVLNMTYQSDAQYVSEDCGERFVLSNLGVTSPNVEQEAIVVKSNKPGTTTTPVSNIELHFE